jgi:hypothetical protein
MAEEVLAKPRLPEVGYVWGNTKCQKRFWQNLANTRGLVLNIFYPLLRLWSNAICGCGRSRKFLSSVVGATIMVVLHDICSAAWRSALKLLGSLRSLAARCDRKSRGLEVGLFSSVLVRSCVGGRSERKGDWGWNWDWGRLGVLRRRGWERGKLFASGNAHGFCFTAGRCLALTLSIQRYIRTAIDGALLFPSTHRSSCYERLLVFSSSTPTLVISNSH